MTTLKNIFRSTISQLLFLCGLWTSISFVLTIGFFLTSCEKERNQTVTVIRDCTGVYLRFENKDYEVCNRDKVDSFADGMTAKATFKKIDTCDKSYTICMMVHPYEIGGLIKVTRIKTP